MKIGELHTIGGGKKSKEETRKLKVEVSVNLHFGRELSLTPEPSIVPMEP